MIKLQDFAHQKGVTDKAIYKHLNKHREQLEGHYEKRGKNGTWLDDFACQYISDLMVSNPVVVDDGTLQRFQAEVERLKNDREQLMMGLLAAKNEINRLTIENKDMAIREASVKLIEAQKEFSDKERDQAKAALAQAQKQSAEITAALAEERAARERLEDEVEHLKSRSFWDRLFNR